MKNGLIHIYTGDGKGKTTAAVGLACRAKCAGLKIRFIQLFKDGKSSEAKYFDNCEFYAESLEKFTWNMSNSEIELYGNNCVKTIKNAIKTECDLLVIDEFFMLITQKIISEEAAAGIILAKPDETELVLTGRNAPKSIIEIADYVSEIKCVKHPYQKGVDARCGIEY